MSAIGSYTVLKRHQYPVCLQRAREVLSEATGKWFFKRTKIVGVGEFKQAWQAALADEVSFDYSGYVLGNYLDAQDSVNQIRLANEQSDEVRVLCEVFTAAFPFHAAMTLLELAPDSLLAFCQEERDQPFNFLHAARHRSAVSMAGKRLPSCSIR